MGKKFLIVLVLIVVILVLIAFFASGPAEAPAPTSEVPAPGFEDVPEMIISTGGAEIVYADAGFSPNPLTIQSGEAVVFRNESSVNFWPASAMHPTHAVYDGTSLSEHCPAGGSFDACAGIAPGESWSFTFAEVGTWRYHDHLSPGRTGTIVVE